MDNNKTYSSTSQEQTDGSFDIKKLLGLFLHNWYWFVISVVVCCGFAVFKVLRTSPQYSRQAVLLIKENNTRRVSSSEVENLLAQAGSMPSKLANEIVVFQAPVLMSEAVERLGLTTEYSLKGKFRNSIVYGPGVPVIADFSKVPDGYSVSFVLNPSKDSTSLVVSDVKYSFKGKKYKVKQISHAEYGKAVTFPFGEVTFEHNPYYFSEKGWTRSEVVVKRPLQAATGMFKSRFSAATQESKTRLSDVITLSLTDYSPQRADDLINMIITVYNENWIIDNNKMSASTSLFIADRLAAIEKELGKIDESITAYKSKNKMPNVEEASKMYTSQATDIARQIRELESQLSVVKYLRNFLVNSVDNDALIPLPSSISSTSISSQVNEYNTMLLNRNNLKSVSSEKNPLVVDLSERLDAMRQAIIASVENQAATLEQQIAFATGQQTQTENKIAQNPSQALDLVKYERVQKVQESLYLYLLQKREENELSQAFSAYNTRIVNPPYGSNVPVSPQKMKILMIAFILGLLIPAGVLYLSLVLDNKVRSKKDLEKIKAPYLGEIPFVSNGDKDEKRILRLIKKSGNADAPLNQLVVEKGSRDMVNEAFRIIRANFEFVCKGTDTKVIMVTSFNPGSGKTFVNVNLASALAINGKKVLLVDCDFRRLTLSRFFDLKKKGLSDYLQDPANANVEDYIAKSVKFGNLDILPGGTLPPNPSEIVARPEFGEALRGLAAKYDYVFLDCPPVDIVADTQIIATYADRTLFIVRAGLLEKDMLNSLNEMVDGNKYNRLSVILNGTAMFGGYGYSKYGYSRYGYGYGRYQYYSNKN